ncbi:GNAT family N-acetyltransferase, partial [[Eubacterium] hominis]|uniref:GNAT family N-acetyltransferase n=1 Tax=[Eubacterium] hominis TaxID=2764325 RepID=UPI003A4E20BB
MDIMLIKDNYFLNDIVEIHLNTFQNFFLSELGKGFLKTLYTGYIEDEESGILIAKENDKAIGFIAFSNNYSDFFKNLIKNKLLRFGFFSCVAIIKNPKIIKKLLGAFNKSNEVKKDKAYVELASIGVSPDYKNQGVGSLLIKKLIEITDFKKYAFISLETDAINNENVNRFYKKNGFILYKKY